LLKIEKLAQYSLNSRLFEGQFLIYDKRNSTNHKADILFLFVPLVYYAFSLVYHAFPFVYHAFALVYQSFSFVPPVYHSFALVYPFSTYA